MHGKDLPIVSSVVVLNNTIETLLEIVGLVIKMSEDHAEMSKEDGTVNGADTSPSLQGSAFKIPKTYKAAVYDKPGTLSTKIVDLETPVPGYGQVGVMSRGFKESSTHL